MNLLIGAPPLCHSTLYLNTSPGGGVQFREMEEVFVVTVFSVISLGPKGERRGDERREKQQNIKIRKQNVKWFAKSSPTGVLSAFKCLLTCVLTDSEFLSFSMAITSHCSDIYCVLDPSSQVSNVCFSRVHSLFSTIPLDSKERSLSRWFSPVQRHRGCCGFNDIDILNSFRFCEREG